MKSKKEVKLARIPSSKPLTENIQACHKAYGNIYDMIMTAAARSRDLAKGSSPLVPNKDHKPCITALLEIEQGKVGPDYLNKPNDQN